MRCLAKNPDERYGDALLLERALATCELGASWSTEEAVTWWGLHQPEIS